MNLKLDIDIDINLKENCEKKNLFRGFSLVLDHHSAPSVNRLTVVPTHAVFVL